MDYDEYALTIQVGDSVEVNRGPFHSAGKVVAIDPSSQMGQFFVRPYVKKDLTRYAWWLAENGFLATMIDSHTAGLEFRKRFVLTGSFPVHRAYLTKICNMKDRVIFMLKK